MHGCDDDDRHGCDDDDTLYCIFLRRTGGEEKGDAASPSLDKLGVEAARVRQRHRRLVLSNTMTDNDYDHGS